MSSWWQNALESRGTTFHYGLQGPLISFQSTLWKRQNVITFSGCIQHYIATIYFHSICLSNTGASAGNWFKAWVSLSTWKIIFFSSDLLGTLTLANFKWFPWNNSTFLRSHFVKLSHPNYFFLLEQAIRAAGRLLWPLSYFTCLHQKWEIDNWVARLSTRSVLITGRVLYVKRENGTIQD